MKSLVGTRYWTFVITLTCALSVGSASVHAALSEKDPVTGTTAPACGEDGKCNIGACSNDPDCPKKLNNLPPPTPRPAEDVQTTCGGTVRLEAEDSNLGEAAQIVAATYPHFNAAQKSKNPRYFDAHPSGAFGTGHAELKGFGVTMVQGTRSSPIDNASGALTDPTLLFFHKDGNKEDDWEIIGMGYSFLYDRDGEAIPIISGIPTNAWLIHEAGYHHSPGNGGYACATNADLKKKAADDGKSLDQQGCIAIAKDDLKEHEFDAEHGRLWTVHIWFQPNTKRPTIATTDPWCRQSNKALTVPSRAFYMRGICS